MGKEFGCIVERCVCLVWNDCGDTSQNCENPPSANRIEQLSV